MKLSDLMWLAQAFQNYAEAMDAVGQPFPLDRKLYLIEFVKWVESERTVIVKKKIKKRII